MRRLSALAAAVLFAGTACGGKSDKSGNQLEPVSQLAGVKGTALARLHEAFPAHADGKGLTSIVSARSHTALGVPVGPKNRFGPSTRRVAVIADVGALSGRKTLRLRWYAVDGAAREQLLTTRTIRVGANERAWSVGTAPAPARPGLYEVVAHLAGRELTTWFRVAQAPLSRSRLASAGSGGTADFSSWSEGTSSQKATGDRCTPYTSGEAYSVTVDADASTAASCGKDRMTIAAAISGNPVQQGSGIGDAAMRTDPCELPGGSDMRGTVVHLLGRDQTSGKSSTADVPITELPMPPLAAATSEPPDGTKVHPGQQVKLRFGAVEVPFAPGIKKVEVFQDGKSVASWVSPSDKPQPCDKSRFIKAFGGTLTIEQSPPKIVEVVVVAEDFEGRKGFATLHFPTQGATWSGKVTASLEQQVPSGTQTALAHLTATLTEDPDGQVTGVLDGQQFQILETSCPSTTVSPGRILAQVSGTFKDEVLSLELGPVDFTKPGVTPCPEGGLPETMGSLIDPLFPPIGKALASITKKGEGYHADAQGTYGQAYPYTVKYAIDLKRAG